ncbi:MAG: bifunctional glutamate N-acetyltransferase/amino-acid acetyltransferase ArgJ [Endomicrobiales bacterium]|nr:bifunctional glutamate N-acetyltransferase/amino-acid acetyltransferase ArgJ [Endomicrobiales bacterium]
MSLPYGFFVAGAHCGLAKNKNKNDIALFLSAVPAQCAGVFTSNCVKAAPVIVSQKKLIKKKEFRAIVANSGCANACTGKGGIQTANAMCDALAKEFGLKSGQVLLASTGVIGKQLPIEKVKNGVATLAKLADSGKCSPTGAASAIMTTDTRQKISARSIKINGKDVKIWACAKGSGMIAPDLKGLHATMLSFILTDALIAANQLQKSLERCVEKTFNRATIDGDTSTNDTVFFLANGLAGNEAITGGKELATFENALYSLCLDLTKMIASDGEGATKIAEIIVNGAKTKADAKKVASTIATSPLVKTALFGNDANWGRVIAAAGRSGVKLNAGKIKIHIGKVLVAKNGTGVNFSETDAKNELLGKEVKLTIDLGLGKQSATYYTCDFSFDYIKVNASYRS